MLKFAVLSIELGKIMPQKRRKADLLQRRTVGKLECDDDNTRNKEIESHVEICFYKVERGKKYAKEDSRRCKGKVKN